MAYSNSTNRGGYMNDTMQSPSAAGKKELFRRSQSVVPLVTCQINNHKDEEFTLFGQPVQIADLCGMLRNFEIQSTKASCTIEDHTGRIKAIMWLESENDAITSIPPVKEGNMVRVFGSIRNQDGEKFIMILKMFPVDDCNVITNHLLQVIEARLAAERVQKNRALGAETSSVNINPTSFSDVKAIEVQPTDYGMKPLQLDLLRLLKSETHEYGMHIDVIMKNFHPSQAKDVDDSLKFLLNEGHIYTTVEPVYYKATN